MVSQLLYQCIPSSTHQKLFRNNIFTSQRSKSEKKGKAMEEPSSHNGKFRTNKTERDFTIKEIE
jgi:hypothetical protein